MSCATFGVYCINFSILSQQSALTPHLDPRIIPIILMKFKCDSRCMCNCTSDERNVHSKLWLAALLAKFMFDSVTRAQSQYQISICLCNTLFSVKLNFHFFHLTLFACVGVSVSLNLFRLKWFGFVFKQNQFESSDSFFCH